ncbi:MAG: hypothetical protein HETSPECPRED_001462 [Heterodermia speciosa]|uniref:Uncharacterized protein n=1 Tax=Heterodermia speciosa TaxID=116794 RepID=A0A8H3J1L5_9LECA|nr:MAG: hypothetical protein HETSPECPRED_001462 [Heterodermia speciosa]
MASFMTILQTLTVLFLTSLVSSTLLDKSLSPGSTLHTRLSYQKASASTSSKPTSNLSAVNPPPGYRINLVFDSAHALSPIGVYNIALDTIYRLSLHPWAGIIEGSVSFSLSEYAEKVLFSPTTTPGRPYSQELQTGYAILALYAGIVTMTPPSRNLFFELKIDVSMENVPVGSCKIYSSPNHPQLLNTTTVNKNNSTTPTLPDTATSKPAAADNHLITDYTTSTTTITDPEDPRYRLTLTYAGNRIQSKDIFLASIDAVAAAARYNPGRACERLTGATVTHDSVVVTVAALRRRPGTRAKDAWKLTYGYASRAMVMVCAAMQREMRWGDAGLRLEYEGVRVGEGLVGVRIGGVGVEEGDEEA